MPHDVPQLHSGIDEIAHLVAVRASRLVSDDHDPRTLDPVVDRFQVVEHACQEARLLGPIFSTALVVIDEELHDTAEKGGEQQACRRNDQHVAHVISRTANNLPERRAGPQRAVDRATAAT